MLVLDLVEVCRRREDLRRVHRLVRRGAVVLSARVRLRAWVRGQIVGRIGVQIGVQIVVRGQCDLRGVRIVRWEVVRARMGGVMVGEIVGGVMVAGVRMMGPGIADRNGVQMFALNVALIEGRVVAPVVGRVVRGQMEELMEGPKGARRVRMAGAMIVVRRRRGCVRSRDRWMTPCRISRRLVETTWAVVPIVAQTVALRVAAASRVGLAAWVGVAGAGVVVGRAGLPAGLRVGAGPQVGLRVAGPTGLVEAIPEC